MSSKTQITLDGRTHILPTSWNAMSRRQQLMACDVLLGTDLVSAFSPRESILAQKIALAVTFLHLSSDFIQQWKDDVAQAVESQDAEAAFLEEMQQVADVFSFFFEPVSTPQEEDEDDESPRAYTLSLSLTRNPFPELALQEGRYLVGPADALENLSLYELCTVFTLFETYVQQQDPQYAHQLIATLWRPPKPDTEENVRSGYRGDRRLPFQHHETTVRDRIPAVQAMPANMQRLILFWFASCRHQIVQSWPNLFRPAQAEQYGERVGNDYGWGALIMSLAGSLANIDTVAAQNYQNAFTYLSYLEDQRIQAEREMRKNEGS